MKENSSFCQACKKKTLYNERYDSYYCQKCNQWSEKICSDAKCFYCTKRPEKPILIKKERPEDAIYEEAIKEFRSFLDETFDRRMEIIQQLEKERNL